MKRLSMIGAILAVLTIGIQVDGQHDDHDHGEVDHAEETSAEHVPPLDPMTGKVTMEGEIIDISCYLRHAATGQQHVKCALFCAEQGMPFGFLEKESKTVYLLLPDGHESPLEGFKEHIGLQVKVTGSLTHGRGLTGLQIDDVETL
ncbi:MAG: hypothetical protein HOM68_18650 [Gemmatimonadetes bacterium]|jgi:hypothetical protein|nr:hypothetical protein [Gemmatimonadota bacterium]MBT5058567.1 hypothetical protein [Gemmatimonadota bacterium]MBT5141129.1 hypothetical protein [Gemmatimonadota bacterium]MBT5591948.1 hypothetical protein [Gemmatimonadota bacterium]MBT5964698.1 hypothetical protein [Gemmatimonadota bacterium]